MPANTDRQKETLLSRDLALAEIIQMIADQGRVPLTALKEDTDLITDLGYDSLDMVELVMNLEERFCIVVSDEQGDKARTIGQITDTVMDCLIRT